MPQVTKIPGRECYQVEGVRQRPDTCLTRERAEAQSEAVMAAMRNAERGSRAGNRTMRGRRRSR